MSDNFIIENTLCKVDDSLGLVLGWGIVCKINGEDYYDLGSPGKHPPDHITEEAMLEATTDFMKNSRIVKDMHIKGEAGVLPGSVVFSFPLTTEIAKAFNIQTEKTGWLVGVMPEDEKVLAKFKDGTYTGFSIGGHVVSGGSEIV